MLYVQSNSISKRKSNFELLRIVATFSIVAGHMASQANLWDVGGNVSKAIVFLCGMGLRIAVNIFLILGTYFMVERKFSATRVLKLYFEVAFFCISITIIMLIVNPENIKISDIIRCFFPLFGRPLWYASAYIALLLIVPFLQSICTWNTNRLAKFILILFVFLSFVSTIPILQESYIADFCWCIFVFLFIVFYKRIENRISTKQELLIGALAVLIYIALVTIRWLCAVYQYKHPILNFLDSMCRVYLTDIKSIPNFLCAFGMFSLFKNLDLGNNKVINFFGTSTFAIYIFHQVPTFYNYLWFRIFNWNIFRESKFAIVYFFICILMIFIVVPVIDKVRKILIETRWTRTKFYKGLEIWLNKFYLDV